MTQMFPNEYLFFGSVFFAAVAYGMYGFDWKVSALLVLIAFFLLLININLRSKKNKSKQSKQGILI